SHGHAAVVVEMRSATSSTVGTSSSKEIAVLSTIGAYIARTAGASDGAAGPTVTPGKLTSQPYPGSYVLYVRAGLRPRTAALAIAPGMPSTSCSCVISI